MPPENRNIPDWARQERQADLDWIRENLDVFWTAATTAFEATGRGAVVVDTTSQPVPGAGHPFAYFSQERVEERDNEDTRRMVAEYGPMHELVLVLLKSGDRTSTYRVGVLPPGLQEAAASEVTLRHTCEPAVEQKLEPPDVETLIEWEAEGGCEAACPHGCWVEAEGVCPHGNPVGCSSWG
jgi:hypothetical protein